VFAPIVVPIGGGDALRVLLGSTGCGVAPNRARPSSGRTAIVAHATAAQSAAAVPFEGWSVNTPKHAFNVSPLARLRPPPPPQEQP
jgi:hypothetical protein